MTDWDQGEWITVQINRHLHIHPDSPNADPALYICCKDLLRSSAGVGICTHTHQSEFWAPLIESAHCSVTWLRYTAGE